MGIVISPGSNPKAFVGTDQTRIPNVILTGTKFTLFLKENNGLSHNRGTKGRHIPVRSSYPEAKWQS